MPDEKKKTVPVCTCICKCFGFFNYRDSHFDYKDLPNFGEADIKIVYRDRIRVFYGKVESAIADGYTDYDKNAFSAKRGFLYSFTGLRGDAKRLYRSIKAGDERRVCLVRCPTEKEQAVHVENADLVIQAFGYNTNKVSILDYEKKAMSFS